MLRYVLLPALRFAPLAFQVDALQERAARLRGVLSRSPEAAPSLMCVLLNCYCPTLGISKHHVVRNLSANLYSRDIVSRDRCSLYILLTLQK